MEHGYDNKKNNLETEKQMSKNVNGEKNDESWMIRQCFMYEEEYNDCKSFKSKFHQYFVDGNFYDCQQWKEDYNNCVKYEESKDSGALEAIVVSEKERRNLRWKAHFENDVWEKRQKRPPLDWSSPLPEIMVKKNENSYLELKSKEMNDGSVKAGEKTLCLIM